MTNARTPASWFFNPYSRSQNKIDSKLPSSSEIASLLDSDASILVLNTQPICWLLKCSMFLLVINMIHQKC